MIFLLPFFLIECSADLVNKNDSASEKGKEVVNKERESKEFLYQGKTYKYEFERRELQFEGLNRTYCLYYPKSLDNTKPVPLVFVLHGGSGAGEITIGVSLGRFNELADRDGFIVVYPDGIEKSWNDGSGIMEWRAHRENINDVGYISALIDSLGRDYNIDKTRVYACGISLGGMLCFRLACELPQRIAAIATIASGLWVGMPDRCSPKQPTSVLMIRGTDDPWVPWQGGLTGHTGVSRNFMEVLSGPEMTAFWVMKNGCDPKPVIHYEPEVNPNDGTRVKRELYQHGRNNTEVVLYTIEGGGHTWPRGYQYWPENIIGKTSQGINACDVIWNFF